MRAATSSTALPSLSHLASISRSDIRRGQVYADYIKSLRVRCEGSNYNGHLRESRANSRYAEFLELGFLALEWPRLDDIDIVISGRIC